MRFPFSFRSESIFKAVSRPPALELCSQVEKALPWQWAGSWAVADLQGGWLLLACPAESVRVSLAAAVALAAVPC